VSEPRSDPAKARFFTIQAVRLFGTACVLVGLLQIVGKFPLLDAVPRWVGYIVLANGLFDVFVVPIMMAKRWRTPR
jgi:hypothetical protein